MIDTATRKKISDTLKRKGIKPPSRKGVKFTDAQKLKLKEKRKQMLNPMKNPETVKKVLARKKETYDLRGRKTHINKRIRESLEYKLWRMAVFTRDNFKCIWCETKINIQADHIKPFAYFPELRFAIDNGRTLCRDCHKTTGTWGCKAGR